jgi:hypothetical protein
MITSSSPNTILEKLEKLKVRFRDSPKGLWPPNQCSDVTTHIAGMFLREHIGVFIEALKKLETKE